MMRFISLLLVLMWVAGCTPNDPVSRLERAQEYFQNADYRIAIIELRNVLDTEPENTAAVLLLGHIYYLIGNAEGAVIQFERALSQGVEPEGERAMSYAEALAQVGRIDDALAQLDRIESVGVSARTQVLRADVLAIGNRLERAAEFYRQALASDPANYDGRLGLARIAAMQEDWATAYEEASRAVELDGSRWEAYRVRGQVQLETRNIAGAEQDLAAAAQRFAEGPESNLEVENLVALAQLQFLLGRTSALEETASLATRRAGGSAAAAFIAGAADFAAGRYEEANRGLLEAVSAAPDHSMALVLLGATNLELGNLGQAESYLRQVVNANPGDPQAVVYLVETRRRQGRIDAALELLRDLPGGNSLRWLVLRADLNMEAGRVEVAANLLEQALQMTPDNPGIRMQLARVYMLDGRQESAYELFGAGGNSPEQITIRTALGLVNELDSVTGDRRAAAGSRAEALVKESPDDPSVLMGAAVFLGIIGEQQAGIELLERAPLTDPAFNNARNILAGIALAQGDALRAAELYQSVVELDANNAPALLGLARVAIIDDIADLAADYAGRAFTAEPSFEAAALLHEARLLGAAGPADESLLQWLELMPDDAQALSLLAQYYQGTGSDSDAAEVYESLLASDAANPIALNNLAWLYHEAGDARALSLAERARAAAPGSGAVLDTYGWVLFHSDGDQAAALEALREAVRLAPEAIDIRYHLAYVLAETGARDEARRILEQIVQPEYRFASKTQAEELLAQLQE